MSTSPPGEPHNPDPWSYPSETIHVEVAPTDILVSPGEEAAERPRRRRLPAYIAAATVVTLLLGGAAIAGARLWYGSGTQPEEAAPSTVVAFARVDLAPGYDQRLVLNDLLKKFPRQGGKDPVDRLKKGVFDSIDVDETAFRDHVKPWLGDRIGAGLWFDDNEPYALITLAIKDQAKANAGLADLGRESESGTFGFVVRKGYALVAYGKTKAQAAADAAGKDADQATLAAEPRFRRGLDSLPARPTALGWVDFDKFGSAMKAMTTAVAAAATEGMPDGFVPPPVPSAISPLGGLFPGMGGLSQTDALKGQLITGARVTGDGVEVRFHGFGTAPGATGPADARAAVDALPANSAIAGSVRVGDLGQTPAGSRSGPIDPMTGEMFDGMSPADAAMLRKALQAERNRTRALTEGLSGISGAKVSVSVSQVGTAGPSFAASAETTSADKATALAGAVKLLGGDVAVSASGSIVEVKSEGYAAEGGALADQALYRQALAGAPEQASAVIYVDVQRLLAGSDLTEQERAQAQAVKAVGLATGLEGGDVVGLLRVIIK